MYRDPGDKRRGVKGVIARSSSGGAHTDYIQIVGPIGKEVRPEVKKGLGGGKEEEKSET